MIIRNYEKHDKKRVMALYNSAFPSVERKPFWLIEQYRKERRGEILILEEEGFAGIAITYLRGDLVLLDYFAIDGRRRGTGLGSRALSALKARYADRRFFLEIERSDVPCDNAAERVRRKHFYAKNGMRETGIHVILFTVPMELLVPETDAAAGRILTGEEYLAMYREMLPPMLAKNVELDSDAGEDSDTNEDRRV